MKDIEKLKHIYTQYKNIDQVDLSPILRDIGLDEVTDDMLYEYIYDFINHDLRDDFLMFGKYELRIYLKERYGLEFKERITYWAWINEEIEKIID